MEVSPQEVRHIHLVLTEKEAMLLKQRLRYIPPSETEQEKQLFARMFEALEKLVG